MKKKPNLPPLPKKKPPTSNPKPSTSSAQANSPPFELATDANGLDHNKLAIAMIVMSVGLLILLMLFLVFFASYMVASNSSSDESSQKQNQNLSSQVDGKQEEQGQGSQDGGEDGSKQPSGDNGGSDNGGSEGGGSEGGGSEGGNHNGGDSGANGRPDGGSGSERDKGRRGGNSSSGSQGGPGDGKLLTGRSGGKYYSSSFFKLKSDGHEVVFLVDGSTAMSGEMMSRAKEELITAIEGLKNEQPFAVIFVGDELSFVESNFSLRLASDDNKVQTMHWIEDFEPADGTMNLSNAASILAGIDVVYVISNSRVSESSVSTIRKSVGGIVNAVGFPEGPGNQMLKALAEGCKGQFRELGNE